AIPKERPPRGLFEAEVGVAACTAQDQRGAVSPVDQDPVRLHVAISPALPVAGQGVVPVLRFQGPMLTQRLDDRAEFGRVLAALLQALDVLLELGGRLRIEGRRKRGRFGRRSLLRLALGHVRYPDPRTSLPGSGSGADS